MSGGYLKNGLDDFQHQVVIFTFKGPIDVAKCKEWNLQIRALKQKMGNNMISVTMTGDDTPDEFKA